VYCPVVDGCKNGNVNVIPYKSCDLKFQLAVKLGKEPESWATGDGVDFISGSLSGTAIGSLSGTTSGSSSGQADCGEPGQKCCPFNENNSEPGVDDDVKAKCNRDLVCVNADSVDNSQCWDYSACG